MEDRLRRLENHVANHPTDYQSVIALLKLRSEAIDKERQKAKIERLRKIAKYRRMLNGESSFE